MIGQVNETIGIYIHIPFCRAKCGYCAFVSTPDMSLQKEYITALVREISQSKWRGATVDTVYIGGGTPSCLYRGGITSVMSAVKDAFTILPDPEITVECNPESVDTGFTDECAACGVNRISMGLQSSNDDILRKIDRVHTFADYTAAMRLLETKFDNISTDIILGLPDQTVADVCYSIDAVADRCSHISVYALAVEEGTPLFMSGYSVDDDGIADLYDAACARLSEHGFYRYEVSNFCKRGKKSKHNCKYWECKPYAGFGVAAHGYNGDRVRYMHGNDIEKYIASPSQIEIAELSDKDMYNEYVMLRLRTEGGIVFDDFFKRFGYSFVRQNEKILQGLSADGLMSVDKFGARIAPDRMFVMNGIIEELMLD